MSASRVVPGAVARLWFAVLDDDDEPVEGLGTADVTSVAWKNRTGGVWSSTTGVSLTSKVAETVAVIAGQLIEFGGGLYGVDVSASAPADGVDAVQLSVVMAAAANHPFPVEHPVDVKRFDAGDHRAAVGLAAADLDDQLEALQTAVDALNDLDAAGIRAAVGLIAADLDDQLSDIGEKQIDIEADVAAVAGLIAALNDLDAAGIRAAVGLIAADLDDQLDAVAAAVTGNNVAIAALNDLDAADVRAAVGMIAADLDDQLDAVAAAIAALNDLDAAGIRAAVGLIAADLDDQLEALQTAVDALPSAADIDTVLSATHGAGSWLSGSGGGGSGTGPNPVNITVNDGTDDLENVQVRLRESVANDLNDTTDVDGLAEFAAESATYQVLLSKNGYGFTPVSLVVNGVVNQTYSMTQTVVSPPDAPEESTGQLLLKVNGVLSGSGVPVSMRIKAGPGVAGVGYVNPVWTVNTNGASIAEWVGLEQGATYELWIGDEDDEPLNVEHKVDVVVPATVSFLVNEVIGTTNLD